MYNTPNSIHTSPQHSILKAFKIKLLMDELPTQQNLHIQHPKKTTTAICQRCNTTIETNTHWIICSKNNTNFTTIINTTITKYLNKYIKNTYRDLLPNINLTTLQHFNTTTTDNLTYTNTTLQGLIP